MADERFTYPERHGALLLFPVPNRRLTNQAGIEPRNLFFLRKEVIQPQVPLRLPCSCASTIRMAAWTISSSLRRVARSRRVVSEGSSSGNLAVS